MRNLAIKGATCQLNIPISTKVYSNGSIGYNFKYPEIINTSPKSEHKTVKNIFLSIEKMNKKSVPQHEERFY